jgi:hypothetical protein
LETWKHDKDIYLDLVPVAHACNPAILEAERRRSEGLQFKVSTGKQFMRPYRKKKKKKSQK